MNSATQRHLEACVPTLQRAAQELLRREPAFSKPELRVEPSRVVLVTSIGTWHFSAEVLTIESFREEMGDADTDALPRQWEPLPEVTMCLTDGRRTERFLGWLRAAYRKQCHSGQPKEVVAFEEVLRPAIDSCLVERGH